jgi:K+-transporting ATPase KdpF subunit
VTWLDALLLLIAIPIAGYLVVALLFPERF